MSTPNMNLDLPTVSVTLGPTWATEINEALEVIDLHDHSSGKGARVPTSGLNINADLEFNNYRASELFSSQYESNSSALTGSANANSVSVTSGNLYFTNNSGVAIQITSGGSLATSPGSASTFEYQSIAANTTILPSDTFVYLAIDTTVSRTITLPLANAVSAGRIYIVKDISGESLDNPITVSTSGSDNIDGASSASLNSNYGSWMIIGDGSSEWYIS